MNFPLTVSQFSFSSSINILISSGMAIAGWVSFSCIATWTTQKKQRISVVVFKCETNFVYPNALSLINMNKRHQIQCELCWMFSTPQHLNIKCSRDVLPYLAVWSDPCALPQLSRTWKLWTCGWCLGELQPPQNTPASDATLSPQRTDIHKQEDSFTFRLIRVMRFVS